MEIAWLVKTARVRPSRPAIPSDLTTGPGGNLSIRLSESALRDGWIGLEKGRPESVRSSELEEVLREDVYDGHSYVDFSTYALALGGSFAGVIVLFYGFGLRRELYSECAALWRELNRPDRAWDLPPIRHGIERRIVLGIDALKLLAISFSERAIDFAFRGRLRGGARAAESVTVPPEVPQMGPVSGMLAGDALELKPPPSADEVTRAKSRSIFPGAQRADGSLCDPIAWDESQWID